VVSQTKQCYSPKIKHFALPKFLGWMRYWLEKPRLRGTGIPLIENCNKLLLCNNFNDGLTFLRNFPFSFFDVVNLLFYAEFYWKGNGPQVVTFL